jgi:hypothetical protein
MAKSDHKRHSAKHKIDRRLGVNLWGRPKSPVNSREYGPGQHGQRRKKPTDFGVQLMAKQKLKGYYGNIGEKQFKKYYKKAASAKGDTGQNLVGILETRLDAVLYRSKMVPTVFRGAPGDQPRARPAEWQAVQHLVGAASSGRRNRAEGQGQEHPGRSRGHRLGRA